MSDEFTYPKRKVKFFVCLFVFSKTEVCREKYYLESKCGIMYACTLNKHKICSQILKEMCGEKYFLFVFFQTEMCSEKYFLESIKLVYKV